MRKHLVAAAVAAMLSVNSGTASAGTDPFMGEVMTAAFGFCPPGWAPMNGQLLAINQNQALFSLLGTSYGGDGETTFALPTAKPIYSASGAPFTQCIALQGVFPPQPD